MKNHRWILILVPIALCGCMIVDEPVNHQPQPSSQVPVAMQNQVAPAGDPRFSQPSTVSNIDVALEWSEKYNELSKKTEQYQKENIDLKQEINILNDKISKLEKELADKNAELDEAGKFMQQMHSELAQWKTDVLGFREEMRSAQAAQLKALAAVIKLLGGEFEVSDVLKEPQNKTKKQEVNK